jgi:hypothetical protein
MINFSESKCFFTILEFQECISLLLLLRVSIIQEEPFLMSVFMVDILNYVGISITIHIIVTVSCMMQNSSSLST